FSLEDLLTNIMIYWTTGTIVSSQRFYKENLGQGVMVHRHEGSLCPLAIQPSLLSYCMPQKSG
uniref:Uncharacterized protein n=1 Tax=Mus spicilegus TaxID=10103 RepID=A0A8C6GP15_MUSSI